MNLILHSLHSVIHKFSHKKLRYLLLERKFVLIYCMMNILEYLKSMVQYQLHHPVINFQNRLKGMCGSFLSTEKILSHLNVFYMNSIHIKLHVENPRSISVYEEKRSIREQILNIYIPYLIKLNLWFHILKLV